MSGCSRLGVVDIGTNTVLLLAVEGGGDNLVRLGDECRFPRLGEGLGERGALSDAAMQRTLAVLREYRRMLDQWRVPRRAVVGTQALREARNAARFLAAAEAEVAAPIEIISGEREAELAFTAIARSLPGLMDSDPVIADVGGGSTEVITSARGRMVELASLPLGAVRHSERFLATDPPAPREVEAMMTAIDAALAGLGLPGGAPVIGTSGTAASIAAVELRLAAYDPDRVHGARLDPAVVERQLARYLELSTAERRHVRGLEPERADVIVAGVAIYARLLARLRAPWFVVSDRGVRWGLAYEMAQDP